MPPIGGFDAGFAGVGEDLGNAHGAITLDVSDLIRAEQVSKTVGRNIEQNLGAAAKGSTNLAREIASVRSAANKAKLGALGQDVAIGNKSLQSAALEYQNFRKQLELTQQQAQSGGGLGNILGRGLSGFQSTIRSLRSELLAIGGAGAITTGFGLTAANEIRAARIRLGQFVQTEDEAQDLMNSLANSAAEFGLNIDQVYSFASTLLPVIEGNVEATDEWVKRAARLRSVFPAAQRGAELRAISEFISGNVTSLQRLFNIAPGLIQEAKDQFSDVGDQLDYILNRMGATEEAARAIADPVVAVKNELKLIAADAFTPILLRLREILPEVRTWLADLRQTRPEIFEIGAGLAVAAAAGAPLLLLAGQLLSTFQKLKALGVLGPLGKLGAAGLIVGGAAVGTTAAVNAIAESQGNQTLAKADFFQIMAEGLKSFVDIILGFNALLAPVIQSIVSSLLNFAQTVVNVYSTLGTILTRIGSFLPDDVGGEAFRNAGEAIANAGAGATEFIQDLKRSNDEHVKDTLERISILRGIVGSFLDQAAQRFRDVFGGGGVSDGSAVSPGGAIGTGAGGLTELEQARIEAIEQYQTAVSETEKRFQDQRLALTEQYEAQRTQIIARYELTISREAEDFARQRARAIAELNSQIEAIRADAAERERQWWQDLEKSISEARADSAKRIGKIEEDADRERERRERQHRITLLEAASRLDARAVAEEQRRFRSQSHDFESDLARRLAEERENLQERIQQERQGFQERLAQARAADEERIEDLKAAQEERFAIEDEERAIRLARMQEDYLAQLEELKQSNRDKQAELKRQYGQELQDLKSEFVKRNAELTSFYGIWQRTQQQQQQASLQAWDDFWSEWLQTQTQAAGGPSTGSGTGGTGTAGTGAGTGTGGNAPDRAELERLARGLAITAGWTQEAIFALMKASKNWTDEQLARWIELNFGYDVPGYAAGTNFVPRTGMAKLHRGEMVIDPVTSAALRGRYGQNAAQNIAYGSHNKRINVGGIHIYAAPNHSVSDIGKEVDRRLLYFLEAMG